MLTPTEKQFIQDHLTDDVRQVVLRTHPAGIDVRKLAGQLVARQKARDKLPSWYANEHVLFPPALSVEQASSEWTAHYKAALVSGQRLFDLTGGMGVDVWAFAQRVEQVMYVEHQPDLAELATHNLPAMGVANVTVRAGDGLAVVEELTQPTDWIYLDPHRRDGQGSKVVRLEDCEPNVLDVLPVLTQKSRHLLLKVSPMIDLKQVGRLLNPAQIHVVAVQGEVKEVLVVLNADRTPEQQTEFTAVNILPDREDRFAFTGTDEQAANAPFGDPQRYLYEPNAAVLKAGAFRLVGSRFGLTKLAPNSHLYTSNALRSDFPGRIFVCENSLKPDRKTVQSLLPTMKANLTVRNFPQSVAELRKKLGLQDGGDCYLFATTLLNGDKRLLICRKTDTP
ncbi:THUMP-like domain-containing protein [Spirosoma arcticum]